MNKIFQILLYATKIIMGNMKGSSLENMELLEKEVCSVEVHVSSFVTELSSLIRPYFVVIQSFRFTSRIRRTISRHLKLINTHSQVSLTLQMFHGPSLFFWYM